ncbi:hypothetical protein [Longispora albida]|uniref:hypothetical protein n=1 Tax=Longispora albida TaxID=203523 RepID=UPI000371899D|nr:hypothetical protein [Longispora albida]
MDHVHVAAEIETVLFTEKQILRRVGELARSIEADHTGKPAPSRPVAAHHVGFDIGDHMIVGYGLDYAGRYRNLRCCAVLAGAAS